MASITIIRGDDEQFETTFSQDGVGIDLTGYTVFFTVKSTDDSLDNDDEAVIQKIIDSFDSPGDDPTNGKIMIHLLNTETDVLPGEYKRDLQIKSATGLISSIQSGKFVVLNDTTRITSAHA